VKAPKQDSFQSALADVWRAIDVTKLIEQKLAKNVTPAPLLQHIFV